MPHANSEPHPRLRPKEDIPDFQNLMLPVLKRISEGDIAFRDLSAKLAQEFILPLGRGKKPQASQRQ